MTGRRLKVLLVEDNPGDVELILDVLNESPAPPECTVASDGVDALARLRSALDFDLVLLDLNLPRKDGRAVLAEIRADVLLSTIPVVVLTSSEAERDLLEVYRLHCNCYLTKPVDLEAFQSVVKAVDDFWLRTARLPA